MTKNNLKSVLCLLFMCAANALSAQAVVTEFFPVNGVFYVDIKDRRIQKIMSTKGVLDLDWNNDKRVLAISYPLANPIKADEVVELVKKVVALPALPKEEAKATPVTPF